MDEGRDAEMPKGKAYGPLNEVDKGARSDGYAKNEGGGGLIKPKPSAAKRKLVSDPAIENQVAKTGAPQRLKKVTLEKTPQRKDVVPEDGKGVEGHEREGVAPNKGDEKDLRPTAAQRSALYGSNSVGQALGYVPRDYWNKSRDLVRPDQTAVDQATAIYYMK